MERIVEESYRKDCLRENRCGRLAYELAAVMCGRRMPTGLFGLVLPSHLRESGSGPCNRNRSNLLDVYHFFGY